jgi:hypothetical protein
MSEDLMEVGIWHRTRDSFLPVLRAADAWKEAHLSQYPHHVVFIDQRGGIDFSMVCFNCVDEVKRVRATSGE